jgi:hypothetical protein
VKTVTRATAAILALSFVVPPAGIAAVRQSAQSGTQQQTPPPAQPQKLPVDMAKIREALKQNPQMRLNTDELRFYVDIIGRIPTFEEIVGDFDLKNGVVPGAGMTHEEYLGMVNREWNTSGAISALETLGVALTSHVLLGLVKRAYQDFQKAKTERERREIQDRIERELRELEKRRAAGTCCI